MLKGNRWVILLNFLLFAGFMVYSIDRNEKTMTNGRAVYLELAPQDPRSLMQGDYIRLTYQIAEIPLDQLRSMPSTGYCVISVDDRSIGKFIRFQPDKKPQRETEITIPFHNNHVQLSIGAESYFFQEGKADRYATAKYGMLKVGQTGNVLLAGLCDSTLKLLN
jgi:uncharacterized membrane-anchored protein